MLEGEVEFGVTGISGVPEVTETAGVGRVTTGFGECGLVVSLTRPTCEKEL